MCFYIHFTKIKINNNKTILHQIILVKFMGKSIFEKRSREARKYFKKSPFPIKNIKK